MTALSLWKGEVKEVQRMTMAEIAEYVCKKHRISIEQLKGPQHFRYVAWPRQEFMWMACQQGRWSTTVIGRFLGGRDHTTVLHGRKRHQERIDQELASISDAA